MNSKISFFKENGYVSYGSILSKSDINKLCSITSKIYERLDKNDPSYFTGGGVEGFNQLIVHDKRAAIILNKLFLDKRIMFFLNEILGKKYRILDISFRRSKPGDIGLNLHQDGVGQVNMAITLDNNLMGQGATAILPHSHLMSQSQKEIDIQIPPILLNTFSFLFKSLGKEKGGVSFFSNRSWHGRFANNSKYNHDVLLIGFFPAGYSYYNQFWPRNLIELKSAAKLGALLGSVGDLKSSFRVCGSDCRESGDIYFSSDHGFSMNIEDKKNMVKRNIPNKIIIYICILKFISILWSRASKIKKWLKNYY